MRRTWVSTDEYIVIPKLFTMAGARCQTRGCIQIARASGLTALRKTPISQDLGRIRGVAYTIRMWIKYWWVLDRRGWVQPQENEPGR